MAPHDERFGKSGGGKTRHLPATPFPDGNCIEEPSSPLPAALVRRLGVARRAFRNRGLRGIWDVLARKLSGQKFIDLADEFTDWVQLAHAGLLHPGNLYCFDYAVRNLPGDAPVLEIGSFCGLSANIITYYLAKHKRLNKLITCDPWYVEGALEGRMIGDTSLSCLEYRTFVKESFVHNVRTFSHDRMPYTVEATSDELFEAWNAKKEVSDVFGRKITLGGEISFCYIDGNHSYDCVQRDFQNCDRFLLPGGFILFDDSDEGVPFDVNKVVHDICRSPAYELVTTNPNYLFRKRQTVPPGR